MPYPHIHRLVVAGGERVGKTAIIEQLIFGNHVIGQGSLPTIADIYDIVLETEKGIHERLQIFDTSGSLFSSNGNENLSEQDHYLSIADGLILVYEITSKASFDLLSVIKQKISTKNKEVPVVVVGNKSDCNAIREVRSDIATAWARPYGIRTYEVTVMNRDSLKAPFCYIAWRMANPGRAFSALPLLTSTVNSATRTLVPTDQSTTHEASPAHKLGDCHQRENSPSLSAGHEASAIENYPSDAMYPAKRSAATLFLGDCLSTKVKQDQQHSSSSPNH